ncbi:InlB B-repeat-containing protein [Leucobacter sp. NPDC058333]|uniref:InlB B-repeat-containing protein n=1 Tax=Leucobacter sp. NPDC058333 TaxID=3346450 RepID=UPI00365E52C1
MTRSRDVLLLALAATLGIAFAFTATAAQAATSTASDWTALETAFSTAADGDIIMLGADIDSTGSASYLSVPVGVGVTLDLNGHTLTLAPVDGPGLHVGQTSSLTVNDSVGTGQLDATGSSNGTGVSPYSPGIGTDTSDNRAGKITILGGSVTARGGMYAAGIGGSRFKGGAELIMQGGSLTAHGGMGASSVGAGNLVHGAMFAGSVTVDGPEDVTGLPVTAGISGPDTEPSPVSYTNPTTGVLVTGSATSGDPDQGTLELAFHYNVIFDFADGVTSTSTQVVDWGKTAVEPAVPDRTGYTFAGWTSSVTGATPASIVTVPVTFTAEWIIDSYPVVFDSANGDAAASQSVEYGHTPIVPANPVRAGYTFTGWTSSVAGVEPTDEITEPVTFTAGWTKDAVVVVDPPVDPPVEPSVVVPPVVAPPMSSTESSPAVPAAAEATLALTGAGGVLPWTIAGVAALTLGAGAMIRARRRA